MNALNYLKQPYPKQESKWKLITFISLFVALFLIIFEPFGINLFEGNKKFLILSGYGLVTFCTLVINLIFIEGIFRRFFDERNWEIWKEFIWLLWIIFSIGLGNAIYTSLVFGLYFTNDLSFYIRFQFITLAVGLIPITIMIITKQKYLLQKHINSAGILNKNIKRKKDTSQNELVRFYAENKKDSIEFRLSDFYFIESSGNYIDLYLSEKGNIIRTTFRSSLKRAMEFFNDMPEIVQCHRAFIVNTNKVINAKGNSQGLRLSLENFNSEIPVSRGFVNFIRKIVK